MQWAHLCRKGAYLIAFGEEKKYEKWQKWERMGKKMDWMGKKMD
jgi:hypothetical protein